MLVLHLGSRCFFSRNIKNNAAQLCSLLGFGQQQVQGSCVSQASLEVSVHLTVRSGGHAGAGIEQKAEQQVTACQICLRCKYPVMDAAPLLVSGATSASACPISHPDTSKLAVDMLHNLQGPGARTYAKLCRSLEAR